MNLWRMIGESICPRLRHGNGLRGVVSLGKIQLHPSGRNLDPDEPGPVRELAGRPPEVREREGIASVMAGSRQLTLERLSCCLCQTA